MADADSPGLAVGLRANDANIATQIDQAVTHAKVGADLCGSTGRIFLAQAAKIQLHAGSAKVKLAVCEHQIVEANERQCGVDRPLIRQTRGRKVPNRAKPSRGNVKGAVALRKAGLGVGDQTRGLCVDAGRATGRRDLVDPRKFALASVARVARLDSSYFLLGGSRQQFDAFGRFSIEVKGTIGSHGVELVQQRKHRAAVSESAADA